MGYTYVTTSGEHRLDTRDGLRHLWTGGYSGPWQSRGPDSGEPAACGYARGPEYLYDLADEGYGSLAEWARDEFACDECVAALRERHNLPRRWPARAVPGDD